MIVCSIIPFSIKFQISVVSIFLLIQFLLYVSALHYVNLCQRLRFQTGVQVAIAHYFCLLLVCSMKIVSCRCPFLLLLMCIQLLIQIYTCLPKVLNVVLYHYPCSPFVIPTTIAAYNFVPFLGCACLFGECYCSFTVPLSITFWIYLPTCTALTLSKYALHSFHTKYKLQSFILSQASFCLIQCKYFLLCIIHTLYHAPATNNNKQTLLSISFYVST